MTYQAKTKAIGLLVADDQSSINFQSRLISVKEVPQKMTEIEKKLAGIELYGATPSGSAILKALNEFDGNGGFFSTEKDAQSELSEIPRIRKIILVTDAYCNAGPPPDEVIPQVSDDLIIDVVGIGKVVACQSWKPMVEKTGGVYLQADSIEKIRSGLEPRIPLIENANVRHSGEIDDPVMKEAMTIFNQFKESKMSQNVFESQRLLEKLRDIRTNLNKRLMESYLQAEFLLLRIRRLAQSRAEESDEHLKENQGSKVGIRAASTSKKNRSTISMSEYAKRTWPLVSEFYQLREDQIRLRKALETLTI